MNLEAITKSALKKSGYRSVADRIRYRNDICAFATEILGIQLSEYQKDILQLFIMTRRLAVRAPRGAGKTTTSAIIILWAVTCFDTDVKVVTTASAWRQLINYTWPEVHKWARKADWAKLGIRLREGIELLAQKIVIGDRLAFAAASDNVASMEGAHGSIIICVFDEAKSIPPALWDAMEGAFSTGQAYAFAISTPGVPSGRFYDIHSRRRGYTDWSVRHVTVSECIAAGRFRADWAEARLHQWGEKSAMYQNQVLANFSESSEDVVIPLSWIEAAHERWYACEGQGQGQETWGCDPGYKGSDPTVTARLRGTVVELLESKPKQDLMKTVGRITSQISKDVPVAVDVNGVGAGVFSRLAELGYSARAVNSSEKCEYHDYTGQKSFLNTRAYLWWSLREALDPELGIDLALPPDDDLTGDLSTPTWEYKSNGVIQVESKKDIRERLDRSTDSADAVALAWYIAAHRGLSDEDIQRLAQGKVIESAVSDAVKAFMKSSGVDVEAFFEARR